MRPDFQYIEQALADAVEHQVFSQNKGRVVEVSGTIIKATGLEVTIGEICILKDHTTHLDHQAEVVGFSGDTVLLTPFGRIVGIGSATEVIATGKQHLVPVGDSMIGRIIDGLGRPLDEEEKGPLTNVNYYTNFGEPPNPLKRNIITKPISLGVRALDGLLTCCEGQRMGIFAGAGFGKSTLLAMIARAAEADVVVLGLIGERGREVREFIEHTLGVDGMTRSVLVVSTSDRPAMERIKAAYTATTIAEFFRNQGKKVLLMIDSITRFARAQRELGLAFGEPPTRRGYPPSFFSKLPILLERSGQSTSGSITAIYTVLVEGDDINEPVADETRSLLDGHIVLSAKLVAANQYPAIDILGSISRVMKNVVSKEHQQAAAVFRNLLAKYDEIELLVKIGEYKSGADADADRALAIIGELRNYLMQSMDEKIDYDDTVRRLIELTRS